jgi:N-acetylmuramoyl-L-alanine amidase
MFFKPRYRSPNFNNRAGGQVPSMLLLHYTGMQTAKAALERLCDPAAEVSSHYVVDEKGKVYHLVEDEKRAWHAGKSHWAGETDINSASIGIEIVNPGHEFGYKPFPERQIASLVKLCAALMIRYAIAPHRVLAHSDVAPARKIDPGHLFPWEVLAREGIGLWPVPNDMDLAAASDLVQSPESFHALLCGYGYDYTLEAGEIIRAFHRHFAPEKFKNWDDTPDTPDILSCARLLSLIRISNSEADARRVS